ncbi:hypothetical protein RRG08_059197 [Elysia crispata]|uniref:Uncharacterized protein n=1 Tax=Elysia crispata TaxID=231223 RepID=A0AAE1DFD2_9GAST|nr:hypothetical protein RRG08_059197 [Elysia crispata]
MARNNGIDNVGSIIGCVNEGKSGNSYLDRFLLRNCETWSDKYLLGNFDRMGVVCLTILVARLFGVGRL